MADEQVVTKSPKSGGVFVSTACGIGLCVLVILLTIGVGVIVYFASVGANLCIFPWSPEQVERSRTEQLEKCDVCKANVTSFTTVPPPTTMKIKRLRRPRPPPANTTLSGVIAPLHYNLDLFMDIYHSNTSQFKLYGNASILVIVKKATNNITFHARDIEIDNSSLRVASAARVPDIVTSFPDKARNFYVIQLKEELVVGKKYLLTLRYEKLMKKASGGIFWTSYQEGNNTRYIVSSHFQPSIARRSFPCFDEPRYKASFRTTIIRHINYTAIFNTDVVKSVQMGDGFVKDIFKTTPPMSTYILAFAVLDYDFLERTMSKGVKYRTGTRPNALQHANIAHQFGSEAFEWLNDNLRPSYPLGKIDNIVLREQPGTAMENWGVVTYKENILITINTTAGSRMRAYRLLAHEHAHQWFGNLVTPLTWGMLWLSEGFVTYFEVIVLDSINPSWREDDYFAINSVQGMLSYEEVTRYPLVRDLAGFGKLTYKKGATIVRMLKNILGKRLFMRAINSYLSENAYGSVVLENLWRVINREAEKTGLHLDIGSKLEPWLRQTHYPLLTVTTSGSGDLQISQKIFQSKWFSENVKAGDEKIRYKWPIPVTYLTGNNSSWTPNQDEPLDVIWLNQDQENALISDPLLPHPLDRNNWVLVNVNRVGYYRVNYNINNWLALIQQLDTDYTVIPPINRAQIIDDAFALERAGQLQFSVALRTLRFLWEDDDYVPWATGYKELTSIASRLENSYLYAAYSAFLKDVAAKHYRNFGLLADNLKTPLDTRQQAKFASLACSYGVKDCLEDAMMIFHNKTLAQRASSELMLAVYCYAIQEGGEGEWNTVQTIYIHTPDLLFSHLLSPSLACLREPLALKRVLQDVLEKNKLKSFHRANFFSRILKSPWTSYIMWNFFKENLERFSSREVRLILQTAGTTLKGKVILEEVKSIQASYSKSKVDVMKNIEKSRAEKEEWMNDKGGDIATWLTELGYGRFIH